MVTVTFSGGTDYSLQISAPVALYFNNTEGVCGNSNGNKHDDPICPDGEPINICWERHLRTTTTAPTTLPSTRTTAVVTTTTAYPNCDLDTQKIVDEECSIITNPDGPFAECALNASQLAESYYYSCQYDLCVALNDSVALCDLLQSYADACMQQIYNLTLNWRSEDFCRKFLET